MTYTLFSFAFLITTSGSFLSTSGAGISPHNATTHPLSPFAAYHNPALLQSEERALHFAYIFMSQDLSISLRGRAPSLDIGESIFQAREYLPDGTTQPLSSHPLPTSSLAPRGSHSPSQNLQYVAVGISQPLLKKRLSIGAVLILPVTYMQRQSPFFVDEREQYFSNSLHFELLEDRYQTQTIAGGIAFSPLTSLSLGVGAVMTMSSQATSSLFMPDASDQRSFLIIPSVSITPTVHFNFGARYAVKPWWLFALSVHLEEKMETTINTEMSLFMDDSTGFGGEGEELTLVYGFLPLRVALGSHLTFGRWQSAITFEYKQWGDYVNRMGERPSIPWHNTISLALHGSFTSSLGVFGADIKIDPSPVPLQEGRENYLDNDRLSLSLSYSYPFTVGGRKMAITATLQYQHLFERTVVKELLRSGAVFDEYPLSASSETGEIIPESQGLQTNNPGYPGYSHSGAVVAGSLMLSVY